MQALCKKIQRVIQENLDQIAREILTPRSLKILTSSLVYKRYYHLDTSYRFTSLMFLHNAVVERLNVFRFPINREQERKIRDILESVYDWFRGILDSFSTVNFMREHFDQLLATGHPEKELMIVFLNPSFFSLFPEEKQNDSKFIEEALMVESEVINYVSEEMREQICRDVSFLERVAKKNLRTLIWIYENYPQFEKEIDQVFNNSLIIKTALQENWRAGKYLPYLPIELNEKDIFAIFSALSEFSKPIPQELFSSLREDLRYNPFFIAKCLQKGFDIWRCLPFTEEKYDFLIESLWQALQTYKKVFLYQFPEEWAEEKHFMQLLLKRMKGSIALNYFQEFSQFAFEKHPTEFFPDFFMASFLIYQKKKVELANYSCPLFRAFYSFLEKNLSKIAFLYKEAEELSNFPKKWEALRIAFRKYFGDDFREKLSKCLIQKNPEAFPYFSHIQQKQFFSQLSRREKGKITVKYGPKFLRPFRKKAK